ncbi:Hypp1098 [Branchiostoma lanceolatum]|uniref:Hypp1098 protein n=1 Tax=Branchiostoma lanceolatum TaxID=7740 RepID=A0A8K0ELJ5_BRALA|nr:Hypp1098 [Branchiostoma lanceolatum]
MAAPEVSVPGDSWTTVVKRGISKETVYPVFIMEREIMTKDEAYSNPIKEEEMYHCLIQTIHPGHLRSVQRVRALWRIYLHNNEARAKLLIEGLSIRKKSVECKETNPFSLKHRMQNMNNTLVTIKDIPESADDSIIVEFMNNAGCKTVGRVNHRKIRYNNRLTNCSNGDRLIYIEQKTVKSIPRNIKIGQHWARFFYNGQDLEQERTDRTNDAQNKRHDDSQAATNSPTTEANMDFIDKAYEEHRMNQRLKRKKKKKKKNRKDREDEDNDVDPPKKEKKQKKSRQRSNSLGDVDEARVTSIMTYLRRAKESQQTKRPRESSSSSETTQTLPAKKVQMEMPQQQEDLCAQQERDNHAVT